MSTLDFHTTLLKWGNSPNWMRFADNVITSAETPNFDEHNVGGLLSEKISDFLEGNKNQLTTGDILPLQNINRHVHKFKIMASKFTLFDPEKKLDELIIKIKNYIQIITDKPLNEEDEVTIHSPGSPKEFSLLFKPSENYTMNQGIQDSFNQTGNLREITASIVNAPPNEIEDFVKNTHALLRAKSPFFPKSIDIFFKHAFSKQHPCFFSFVHDDKFLTKILKNLPINSLTNLNLKNCATLTDSHVDIIAKRMKKLVVLNLTNCKSLTEQSTFSICNGEMKELQCVYLDPALKASTECAQAILQSPSLKKVLALDYIFKQMSRNAHQELQDFLKTQKSKRKEIKAEEKSELH